MTSADYYADCAAVERWGGRKGDGRIRVKVKVRDSQGKWRQDTLLEVRVTCRWDEPRGVLECGEASHVLAALPFSIQRVALI